MSGAEVPVVNSHVLRHDCAIPRSARRTGEAASWTCLVCRRTWTVHPNGNAECRGTGSVVVSFTMLHLDGTSETFEVEHG